MLKVVVGLLTAVNTGKTTVNTAITTLAGQITGAGGPNPLASIADGVSKSLSSV